MKKIFVAIVCITIGAALIFLGFNLPTGQIQSEIHKETEPHLYKGETIHEERFFLKNSATGNLQRVHMFYTVINAPAVILVPGGGKSSRDFVETALDGAADFVVFTFDPLGRGESQGVENMHGRKDQAFLYQLYRYAQSHSNGSVSVVSFSFGIAMVAGALADYDMPVEVWIDWEGPHDRTFIAHLCLETREDMEGLSLREKRRIREEMLEKIAQGTALGECADDDFWAEREAFYTVERIEKGEIKLYVRLQGRNDHVHGNFCDHALEMVNKMTASGFTARLNDGPENMMYTGKTFSEFLYSPLNSRQKALDILRGYYSGKEDLCCLNFRALARRNSMLFYT